MTQEFHLRITALGADEVFARIERGSMGTPLAEERYQWPIADWLEMLQEILREPYSTQRSMDPTVLGKSLYQALFQGSLKQSWDIAQGIAQNRGQILRLRLGVKDDKDYPQRLQHLPWEILHDEHRPLATAQSVIFSRYQPNFGPLNRHFSAQTSTTDHCQPLRILMVLATPEDQAQLALKQEALLLQQELQTCAVDQNRHQLSIELQILEQPGREQLTQVLEQGQYHIFHFAGHSSPGALHLVNRHTGLTERLPGEDLAGLLRNNQISLALLNSCRGHYGDPAPLIDLPERKSSLADILVKSGLPAVLAMAEQIPDRVALTLTRLFYRNLKLGYPIDLSLCRARQGLLSSYGAQYFYWCLPILYLQSDFDGQFFSLGSQGEMEQEWLLTPALDVSALTLDGIRNPTVDPIHKPSVPTRWLQDMARPIHVNPPEDPLEAPGELAVSELSSSDLSAAVDPHSIAARSLHPLAPILEPSPLSSLDHSEEEDSLAALPLPSDPESQRWFAQLSASHGVDEEEELIPLGDEHLLLEDGLEDPPPLSHYPDLPDPQGSRGTTRNGTKSSSSAYAAQREASLGTTTLMDGTEESHAQSEAESSTIALYRQTLALNPTDARTYHKLGLSLVEAGQVGEGIEAYHQALTFNANDPSVYQSLGEALCRQEDYQSAIVAYRQAIALNPNLTEVYRLLAIALAKQGRAAFFPTRVEPVQPSPTSDPEPATPPPADLSALDLGEEPAAIDEEKAHPFGLPLWFWLGSTGIAAIVTLNLVFPNSWQLFHPLHRNVDNVESVPGSLNSTQPQISEQNQGLVVYALAAFEDDRWQEGAEILQSLLDESDLPGAEAILTQLSPAQLDRPEISFLYGRFAWQATQAGLEGWRWEDARLYWQTAHQKDPQSTPYLNALALAHYQLKDYSTAKSLWLQVLPLEGESEDALFANGNPLGGRYPNARLYIILCKRQTKPILQG
ncbi:MAG: CHAT domain-containing protein, partial [Prochlorotrichaceae cyanobacterium]